jgi:hypothetical protein
MKTLAKIIGLLSLAATIVPPALFAFKMMPLDQMKLVMLIATFTWFITAPIWMKTDEA